MLAQRLRQNVSTKAETEITRHSLTGGITEQALKSQKSQKEKQLFYTEAGDQLQLPLDP